VVAATLDAGASIVNDVSGLRYPEVARLCAAAGAALVIMHTRAQPKVRLQNPGEYDDVFADVRDFLETRMATAVEAGLPPEAVILDPGPDFAKTPAQTVAVLRRLKELRALGRPILLALSRKDFLGAILGRPPRGRDAGTLAALSFFATDPGYIARVHDVRATVDAVRTLDVLAGRADVPWDYLLPDELRHERVRR
jgi:dihydropteroate synthase